MKVGRTVPYTDPLHAGRHPFQTYLLTVCVLSGIPLLFGEPSANSIEAALPAWGAGAWGACLSIGAVLALTGSYWPRRRYATALTLERIGLLIVGPASLFYGVVIFAYLGVGGTPSALITIGFGFSAVSRAYDIGKVVKRAIAKVENDPTSVIRREGESALAAVVRNEGHEEA